jgi:hypothetical protein
MNQLTDNIVDLVNCAADDDLEDDNEGPEKADRMNHSEGLNSIETTVDYVEQEREAIARLPLFRPGVTLPRGGGGLEANTQY